MKIHYNNRKRLAPDLEQGLDEIDAAVAERGGPVGLDVLPLLGREADQVGDEGRIDAHFRDVAHHLGGAGARQLEGLLEDPRQVAELVNALR